MLSMAACSLVFWMLLSLDRSRRWPAELFLESGADHTGGSVVAIVPARDEAVILPRTLPGLLDQLSGKLRIVLVDDGSTDGTASVAERLAAEVEKTSQLEVVRIEELPAGWAGKVFAMQTGLKAIERLGERPDWLLLTDADIRHPPGSAAALLDKAARGGYDMVSVMVRLRAETFWEGVIIPAFVFFFHLLYPFRRVGHRSSSVAAAAGGCVLVRTEALIAAGGFEAFREVVIDDVALARTLKDAGCHLWLGFGDAIRSVRPYPRLRDLWQMISRTAFVQLSYRWELVLLVVLGLLVTVAGPAWLVGIGLVELVRGPRPETSSLLACAAMIWGLQFRCLWPYVRHHRISRLYAFSLPLAGLLYAGMTVSSAWEHLRHRGARWKGRKHGPM